MALVDPAVSRAKFARELATYRQLEDDYRRRGWWMLKAEFPEIFIVFASSKTKPPAVVFGAILDFTDYDLKPPSVKLVHPFTQEPYQAKDLPAQLWQRVAPSPVPDGDTTPSPTEVQPRPLMMAHSPEDVPFLCIPGVREYHDHPAHTGDVWLPRRGLIEGTMHFLIERISRYGVDPINGVEIGFEITKVHIRGFQYATVFE